MSGFVQAVSYVQVDVTDDGRIALVAVSDDPSARDVLHALAFVRTADGKWSGCLLNNRLVGIHLSLPGEPFDALGLAIDGGVCRIVDSQAEWSLVEVGDEGPNTLVPLIVSRRIGDGHIVATGMQRRTYAGDASGWRRIDAGLRIEDTAISGLMTIDGSSPEQLWAGGYSGEIWRRVAGHWSRIDSPTNGKIVVMRQYDDGSVIAAGLKGLAFIGSDGGWRQIGGLEPYTAVAIESFHGRTYAAVMGGALYVLEPDGFRRDEEIGSFPVYAMRACGNVLLVAGPFGLRMRDTDGWREVEPPIPVGQP